MTALALRSLRHRPTAAVATFVAVLLGTAMMASFATLVESAFGAHDDDRELLLIMGAVVGGWGSLIVVFSVASTVGSIFEAEAHCHWLSAITGQPLRVHTVLACGADSYAVARSPRCRRARSFTLVAGHARRPAVRDCRIGAAGGPANESAILRACRRGRRAERSCMPRMPRHFG